MNYTTNDKLNELRVGDTLTLEDGSVHKAVKDKEYSGCNNCTIDEYGDCCLKVKCAKYNFHFKKIEL
jgi:hypothetical protein